jgi:hypothetical protein
MPRISEFYGIAIYMYFRAAALPRAVRRRGAVIAIADGRVMRGELPERALRLVREWVEAHRRELDENWRLASEPGPLKRIDPLR